MSSFPLCSLFRFSLLAMVAMPKLKSVLGKRPGTLSFQRQADDPPPKVSKSREFSEGFAMAARHCRGQKLRRYMGSSTLLKANTSDAL